MFKVKDKEGIENHVLWVWSELIGYAEKRFTSA